MMKRVVIEAIIKMCAKSIFLTAIIGVIIGVIGYLSQWNSSIAYSNAFFLAGCLVLIAGGLSRFASGQGFSHFQLLDAESFRGMSPGERANYIIDISSSTSNLILSLLSGLSLMVISAMAAYMS